MTKNETKIQINTEMLITEWETKFDIFLLKKFIKWLKKALIFKYELFWRIIHIEAKKWKSLNKLRLNLYWIKIVHINTL